MQKSYVKNIWMIERKLIEERNTTCNFSPVEAREIVVTSSFG